MVERQAERTPEAVAVIFEAERWSYRDLVRRSREIAASLRGQGVGPGDRVAILDQRSAERVARVLGVLASGATYVAIDSEQPQAWRARILADLAPVRVLPPREATLHDPEPSSRDSESRLLAIGGELPGYVVYTSGSTGRPKGIVAHHRGAATYLEWVIRNYGLAESDVALQLAPLTFDASLRDTLAPLAAGGRIVIVPEGVVRDPAALLERIAAHGVTCLPSIVPSLLRLLVEEALASGRTFPSLRLILASGEKLHGVDAAAVRRAFGEKVGLVNQYGPSEATMTSTWYPVTAADESLPALPVGRPAASARVFLLDRALRPVPPGAAGEICLGGPGLAFGYLGQPDRTAEVFIPDPFGAPGDRLYRTGDRGRHRPDGVLELLGRIDLQVKIRGQRVEPGEIEAMLRSHPEVREAVVAALGEGEPRLAAWLVADGTGADDLRAFLAERLPASMVPADWAFLDALPLTLHGKVDRSRLPDPGRERRAVQEPRDRIELRLVRLWEEILGIPAIGVSDNFFALGGHSLAAVRLMAGIRRLFGRELPLAELFQRPTIEALAELLRRNERDLPWSPLVALTPGCAEKAPLFCIHGADGHALTFGDFARALSEAGEDRPVFALEARGLADGQEPLQSIEEMADLYLAAIREVRPRGPYRLLGYSMGSKIAFTMARELERAGETVEQLVLVDIPTLPRAEVLPPPEIPENLRALPDFDAELAGRHVAVWTANQEASRLWRAAPYKGKALLIVAEDGVCAGAADPALGWGAVAEGGVEVVSCPGDHFTLFRPPYVETLAERIRTGGTGMKDRASSPGTQVGGSPAEK
jgi:amino acid adenylation domain-containing protein